MQNWVLTENQLTRTFEFPTFEAAMAFMGDAARVIAAMDHHPRWTNQYNRIEVWLCTHDAGNTVTQKDYDLAAALDGLYEDLIKVTK